MMRTLVVIAALLAAAPAIARPALPSDAHWAALPAPPRLMLTASDWAALRARIETDPVAAKLFEIQRLRGEQMLSEPVVPYVKQGRRLDTGSGFGRILTLAQLARLTDDPRFLEKAALELRHLAKLPTWNPDHFLDVATAASALALGRDWLHDRLSPETLRLCEDALIEKALRPSFDPKFNRWVSNPNNWNQVCHSGMVLAALAVAEREPDLARRTVERALQNLPRAASAYAPDGAYPEGPGYWDYGTGYHVRLIDALRSAFGDDFGTAAFPGFLASADYLAQTTAPSGDVFNYADTTETPQPKPTLYWFTRERAQPDLARWELARLDTLLVAARAGKKSEHLTMPLLWWRPVATATATATATAAPAPLPLHWNARGDVPLSVHRSAWHDPRATYLAIKAGSARTPHAHLDGGSFVLEADGVRWAVDPGLQDYHSLESKGIKLWNTAPDSPRWRVFRLGADAHNLLRFDGAAPDVNARATIARFQPAGPRPHTLLDLTPLYSTRATAVRRGVALLPDRSVLFQDEWTLGASPAAPVTVAAQWLTRAERIDLEPGRAVLHQAGQRLELRLLVTAPADVVFRVEDVSVPRADYDAPNPGLKRLVISTRTAPSASGRLVLHAVPGSVAAIPSPELLPLSAWK